MDIPHWMKICVAIAQICTPFLAFAVFIVTVMLAARSKQADILIECHRRHTDLDRSPCRAPEEDEEDVPKKNSGTQHARSMMGHILGS